MRASLGVAQHELSLSPVYAYLKRPSSNSVRTSTRDLLLSGTTILHLTFLHADVNVQLVVFEALATCVLE